MNEFDREWLTDMLEYAQAAIRMLGSSDAAALQADEKTFLAVCYAIQIVGEAANKVSPSGRAALPEVPWHQVVAMRHKLVHGYGSRSAEVVEQTVTESLPVLVVALEGALKEETP